MRLEVIVEREICPDCKRKKARNADDCANGDCDKWYAVRDPEAKAECARIALEHEMSARNEENYLKTC